MKNKITKIKLIGLFLGIMVTSFTRAQIANNIVSSAQVICEGGTPSMFNGSLPTGGLGIYNYQWQWSQSSDTDGFANISLAILQDFQSVSLSATTWFRRVADDGLMGDTSVAIEVTVNPKPVADAFLASNTQCFKNNSFSFLDFTSITSGTYSVMWDFGDGNTDTISNPTHSYTANGSYTTKLVATSDMGCMDSITLDIIVNSSTTALLSVNKTSDCFNGNSFKFIDSSSLNYGTYTRVWDYGDGNSDTTAMPTYSYSSDGNYTVNLILTTDSGCVDTATTNLTVNPSPDAKASLNNASQCLTGNNFMYIDSSSISSGTFTRVWDFGDTNTDTAANPSHSYTSTGNYNASLTITSGKGCTNTATWTTHVNSMPSANYTINNSSQCLSGNSFKFTDASSIATGSYTRVWHFGDSNTDTSANPTHNYSSSGSYNTRLIITSDKGCIDSINLAAIVNPMPVAKASVNKSKQCFDGNNFMHTDSSSISSGSFTRVWDFGDTHTDTSANPSHTYASAGSYNASLKITSDMGCENTTTWTVEVYASPIAKASVNSATQCFNGNNFMYTDSSSISSGTYSLLWDFGDGNTDTIANPSHNYSNSGTYNSSLKITSDKGCTNTASWSATVNVSPVAKVSVNNSTQCLTSNNFIHTDSSTISSGSYTRLWDFGDGNTDTTANPSHTYGAANSYNASLKITSDLGCSNTTTWVAIVNPMPTANASVNTASQCLTNNQFKFNSNPTLSSTIAWDFGDGNTDTAQNPSHSYTSAGNYSVNISVKSNKGCITTSNISVSVLAMPVSKPTVDNSALCLKDNVFNFIDSSAVALGTYTRLWDLGDNIQDTSINPPHVYSADGSYTVSLKITTDKGCSDSTTININVYPMPNAVAWVSDESQCFSYNSFSFLDFSNISSGSYSLVWDFGDGSTDTNANISHPYQAAGSYVTNLMLTSDMGCRDTSSLNINVNPSASLSLHVNSTSQCLNGNSFSFADSSTVSSGSYTRLWDYGDGSSDTAAMPTYNYSNYGDYTASLIITTDSGCVDTSTVKISVNPDPTANAWVNSSSQCLRGNNFSYIDSSTLTTGSYTREWDFGDGTKDTSATPSHTYKSDGVFNGSLKITSDMSCTSTATWATTINPMPKAAAWVNADTQCFNGNDFQFADFSSIPAGTYSLIWDFGDNSSDTIPNPSHSYSTDAGYTASLIITSDMGCMDTAILNLMVNPSPNAVAWVNTESQCFKGNNYSFLDFSNISSGTYSVLWDFGDGSTDTSSGPSHVYNSAGNYTTNLILTSDRGCMDTSALALSANPATSISLSISNTSACFKGNSFTFADSSTISSGSYTRLWDYGDGTNDTSAMRIYSYSNIGDYNVTLITTTDSGCIDTAKVKISVNPEPSAKIYSNILSSCLNGNNFLFIDSSSIAMGSYSRTWDFGDGNTDTSAMPTHKYAKAGTYNVALKLLSSAGCTDSVAVSITVFPTPIAFLKVDNASQCITGNSFHFKDSSSISSGSYTRLWNFGNGKNDTSASPIISYATVGTYNVTLFLTSDKGCTQLASTTVNVNPNPVAIATAGGPTTFCTGGNVLLTSNGSGVTYQWKRNGVNIAGGIDSTIFVNTSGAYTVVVTNISGCSSTSNTINVTVNAKQNLGSITGNATVNVPNVETYSVAFISGITYTWVVSAGNIISGQGSNAIQVQWSKIGNGFVKVVAQCYDTSVLNISIPNGIAVATNSKAEIFPNPTNGNITIKLPDANTFNTIRIFDLTGKLILTHNLNGEKQLNMNLESYNQGVYIIEIIGKDAIIQEKIVVSH